MTNTNNSIELLCSFVSFRYRDEKSGYSIFNVKPSSKNTEGKDKITNKTVICKGLIPDYVDGTPLLVQGEWEYVEKYKSWQINAKSVSQVALDEIQTITYLQSICEGVGDKTAKDVTDFCGYNLFEFVLRDDAVETLVKNVPRLNEDMAINLVESIRSTVVIKQIYDCLGGFGIDKFNAAEKIAKKYGIKAKESLLSNPYKIGLNNGLNLLDCDSIAASQGVTSTSDMRIKAVLIAAQKYETLSGHMYSSESIICQRANQILKNKGLYKKALPNSLLVKALSELDDIVFEYDNEGNEGIYLKENYLIEQNIVHQVKRLINSSTELNYDDSIIEWAENTINIKYAPAQKEAFTLAKKTGVAILRGGPGTGKTTTVNGVLMAIEKLNPNIKIALSAPTGRAAQRMAESTGREAITIHRLLNYQPFGNDITYKTAEDPIDADVIIVDESSMIDAELCSIFLSAVKNGTLVIFIGDVAQLPSVGAGCVLKDFIDSGEIPVVTLSTIYRQGETSPIISNANSINNGFSKLKNDNDFQIYFCENAEIVASSVINCCLDYHRPNDPFYTQVLIPSKMGDAGVDAINKKLQEILNPSDKDTKKEIKFGTKIFREGDKILLQKNNYEIGYFNGDLGIVKKVEDKELILDINGQDIVLDKSLLDDLALAYAMTIHKSQGSEFPNVIISLPQCNMLERNLLFTAVTRAKKKVFLMAEYGAIRKAVETKRNNERRSRLKKRLKGEI